MGQEGIHYDDRCELRECRRCEEFQSPTEFTRDPDGLVCDDCERELDQLQVDSYLEQTQPRAD